MSYSVPKAAHYIQTDSNHGHQFRNSLAQDSLLPQMEGKPKQRGNLL